MNDAIAITILSNLGTFVAISVAVGRAALRVENRLTRLETKIEGMNK